MCRSPPQEINALKFCYLFITLKLIILIWYRIITKLINRPYLMLPFNKNQTLPAVVCFALNHKHDLVLSMIVSCFFCLCIGILLIQNIRYTGWNSMIYVSDIIVQQSPDKQVVGVEMWNWWLETGSGVMLCCVNELKVYSTLSTVYSCEEMIQGRAFVSW